MPPLEARRNLLLFLVALALPFVINAAEAHKREQKGPNLHGLRMAPARLATE